MGLAGSAANNRCAALCAHTSCRQFARPAGQSEAFCGGRQLAAAAATDAAANWLRATSERPTDN